MGAGGGVPSIVGQWMDPQVRTGGGEGSYQRDGNGEEGEEGRGKKSM